MGKSGVSPETCRFLKIETIDNARVLKMHFDSIGEVQYFLKDNPSRNETVFVEFKSEKASEEFAGPPLKQAIEYCIGGYEERYEQFLSFARELETINRQFARGRHTETSFVGQRPNVPAYVAGAPKTMYRTKRFEEKKVINIFMNITYSMSETEAQIQYRGIITLNLIRILEQNNYIVNFRLFEITNMRNEVFICEVVLKKPGEQLDSRLCYYPMCGKGFVRRVLARIKESMPFCQKWGLGYGSVLPEKTARRFMNIRENDLYIGTPTEMGISGKNIYEDADAFMEKLGLQDKIVLPSYKKEQANMPS